MKIRFLHLLSMCTFFLIISGAVCASEMKTERVEVDPLLAASPPKGMSLSALPTGTYETRAAFAFNGGAWSDIRNFASTAVLVRHPKGNLLIDAGFGSKLEEHLKLISFLQRAPHHKGATVVEQLVANGRGVNQIAAVIPTHSHWDHISGLQDLPGIPVLISNEAKHWIDTGPKGTEVLRSFSDLNFKEYTFDNGPYLGFPRSHDVWGDGSVVIVSAPGHTPDSVIVFINLPSGARYALIGDLAWQMEGLDIPAQKPWWLRRVIGEHDADIETGINLIRTARNKYPQLQVIPAHDLKAFRSMPVFPAFIQ